MNAMTDFFCSSPPSKEMVENLLYLFSSTGEPQVNGIPESNEIISVISFTIARTILTFNKKIKSNAEYP